jgi:hypothetical protein
MELQVALLKTLSDAWKGCDPACNRQVTRWYVDVWRNEIVDNLPTEMNLNEFASYFEIERTWIGTPTTEPIFDKYLWNMYDSVLAGLPRSNNLVECWHNGFQTLVGCSNPTLWTFLTALKKEENLTFSKKVTMSLGEGPEPKRRKWRTSSTALERCCSRAKSSVLIR